MVFHFNVIPTCVLLSGITSSGVVRRRRMTFQKMDYECITVGMHAYFSGGDPHVFAKSVVSI